MKKKLLIVLVGLVVIVLGGVMIFGNVPPDSSGGHFKGVVKVKEVAPVKGSLKGDSVKEAPKSKKPPVNSAKTRDDLMPEGQDSDNANVCNGDDCSYYRTSTCVQDKAGNPVAPLTQDDEVTYSNLCEDEYDECMAPCN